MTCYRCKHCNKIIKEPLRIADNWWCRVFCYRAFYRLNHTIYFGPTVSTDWPKDYTEDKS